MWYKYGKQIESKFSLYDIRNEKILKTKILLADDHKIMRAGLRSILEKQPDMEILGEAQNGLVALQLLRNFGPI